MAVLLPSHLCAARYQLLKKTAIQLPLDFHNADGAKFIFSTYGSGSDRPIAAGQNFMDMGNCPLYKMSKKFNCFGGAALVLILTFIGYLIPVPDYESLSTVQGKVFHSYKKTVNTGKNSTRYIVLEIQSRSGSYTVFIERFKAFTRIKVGDEVSIKANAEYKKLTEIHAWEVIVNGKLAISFEQFEQHYQSRGKYYLVFGFIFAAILVLVGIFSTEER